MTNTSEVIDENSKRTKGIDALSSNIEAARAVSELIKSTLGPKGMDKMLIDSYGDTVVTNDGVKILTEMEIEHPGAKMLVEVAKTQEKEVGDGTTTAVILSGEQLSKSKELIEMKIHQTEIIRIFQEASKEALKILNDNCQKFDINKYEEVKQICDTAITGKIAENSKEIISKIIFELVSYLKDDSSNKILSNRLKTIKCASGNIEESEIIKGMVIDKKPANHNMPKKISEGKILLIEFPLEVKEIESDANINLNSYKEYEEFIKSEQEYLISIVNKIKESGANTVICQKGIDDGVAYYLAKEGIIGIRRTRKSDIEKLSYALNIPIVNNEEDINKNNLGKAQTVSFKEIEKEEYLFIEGVDNPKALSLVLKSSTKHILDEIERAIEDAIGDVASAYKTKKKVAGGGAIEIEIHNKLNEISKEKTGKEQIIFNSYAESFLIIPKVLCQNSGLDEIEIVTNLIDLHLKNKKFSGINSYTGIDENTVNTGIVEPYEIKKQAIISALEICSMILRIDDIIIAKKISNDTYQ